MVTVFVRAKVSDYGNWKRVYDGFASMRKERGITGASVHRDAKDPNALTVTQRFNDLNTATAFVNSEELKSGWPAPRIFGSPRTSNAPHTNDGWPEAGAG
jgi:quinol monooxygenase YgiN